MSFFKKLKGRKDLEDANNENMRPRRTAAMACVPFLSSSEAEPSGKVELQMTLSPAGSMDRLEALREAELLHSLRDELAGASGMVPAESSREMDAEYVENILQQNLAYRNNFERLKELFLLLADVNNELEEELVQVQEGKEEARDNWNDLQCLQQKMDEQVLVQVEAVSTSLKGEALAHAQEVSAWENKCEQANSSVGEILARTKDLEKEIERLKIENKDLMDKLESLRMQKDQALIEKHAMELEHAKEIVALKLEDKTCRQQAGDLTQKCMHLQSQLDSAVASGAAAHDHFLSLIYQKDAAIANLEETKNKLEKGRHEEVSRREEIEHKLKDVVLGIQEEEEKQRRIKRSFDAEAADLRGKIMQLEQSAYETEVKHIDAARTASTENETRRRELADCKHESKQARLALAEAQKEAAKLLAENEGLRFQLQDAVNKYQETHSRTADNKSTIGELQRKLGRMKIEIEELNALRSKDLMNQSRLMDEAQRNWDAEKTALVKREVSNVKDERKKLIHEVHSLKKKLNQAYKLEANLTVSQNQLLVRVRELEVQLALAQGIKWSLDHPLEPTVDGISAGKILNLNSYRDHSTWLKAEIEDLERRQSRCLSTARKLCKT